MSRTAHIVRRVRVECEEYGWPVPPDDSTADAAIAHMADAAWADMDAHVGRLSAERDRLARVLAVERGDIGQAPGSWLCNYAVDSWSRHVDGRLVIIQRFARDPGITVWEQRGIRRSDPRHQEWSTALEAMEAIDAGAQ